MIIRATVTGILSALWLPIALRFYRAWKTRQNPVSLAITCLIFTVIYFQLLTVFSVFAPLNSFVVLYTMLGFSFLACTNFYISFYWASRKFKDFRLPK